MGDHPKGRCKHSDKKCSHLEEWRGAAVHDRHKDRSAVSQQERQDRKEPEPNRNTRKGHFALIVRRKHPGSLRSVTCAIVIPARMASTRFPGKPLCDLAGKPMVQWVYEAAQRSEITERIVIATPDDEILEACRFFGAEGMKTRADHPSGTDRIAEVAKALDLDFFVNVQGDEPLIDPETIRACALPLLESSDVQMASVFALARTEELDNPAVVKVVTSLDGDAIYFSRYPIPYPRNERQGAVKKHIGIYAYTREILLQFSSWKPTPLEVAESLEQLRFLENGVRIRMAEGRESAIAVDTPEQADEARRLLHRASQI